LSLQTSLANRRDGLRKILKAASARSACGFFLDTAYFFQNNGNMEKQIIVTALDALAQETRLDIFRLLVPLGDGGMPAGKIGEQLGIPNATLSFHLQQLKHAGLVSTQRKGTQIIYMANYAMMNGVLAYLTENCCQGQAENCVQSSVCDCSDVQFANGQ
jgi:predicted transcriptional regulator